MNALMNTDAPLPAWGVMPSEWKMRCVERGLPGYRADQITTALYQTFIDTWQDATTLPRALRERLEEAFPLHPLSVVKIHDAEDGVRKLLLACADEERIETVLIPSKERMTQCISTQVGCAMRCAFCASGADGCARSLTADEIVGQVMAACAFLRATLPPVDMTPRPGVKPMLPRPGNIVVMGMGEPFNNYDAVMRALRVINAQKGLAIGARHITLSTCGIVPGIERLATEGLQFELSISLHAPNDTIRNQLMPVNARWPIDVLLAACQAYNRATDRLITFEYTLVSGVNDQLCHADELIRRIRPIPCKVNLIQLNPVAHNTALKRPSDATCMAFLDRLMKAKIVTTLRRSRGTDVAAACGQLRRM